MRATSHYKVFVWTGEGRICTESGIRENIDAGLELSRPFIASPGWLRRHEPLSEYLVPQDEHEASKRPTPAKVVAVAKEKPTAVKPKRKRKAAPKTTD